MRKREFKEPSYFYSYKKWSHVPHSTHSFPNSLTKGVIHALGLPQYSPSRAARIDSVVVSEIYAMVARTIAGKYPVMPLKNEPANNIYSGRSKYTTSNVSDISTVAPKHGRQMAGLRPTLSDHAPSNSPVISDGAPAKKINPNM